MGCYFKQNGGSLIEVLVSLAILSIGLLGLASLQTNAIRYNQTSYQRSIATSQSHYIAEKMRANPFAVNDGLFDNVSGTPNAPQCDPCNTTDMANKDLNTWNTNNQQKLPQGMGSINQANGIHSIRIQWNGELTTINNDHCNGDDASIACYQMDVRL